MNKIVILVVSESVCAMIPIDISHLRRNERRLIIACINILPQLPFMRTVLRGTLVDGVYTMSVCTEHAILDGRIARRLLELTAYLRSHQLIDDEAEDYLLMAAFSRSQENTTIH